MAPKEISTLRTDVLEFRLEGKSLIFEATYLVPKQLDEALIRQYFWTLEGKPIDYRHIVIQEHPAAFLGRFNRAWLEKNGGLKMKAEGEIFSDTKVQREVQKDMRGKKLTGISAYYVTMKNPETQEPLRVEFMGGALTPNPLLKECRIDRILNEEEGLSMNNEGTDPNEGTNIPPEPPASPPSPPSSTPVQPPPTAPIETPVSTTSPDLDQKLIALQVENDELRRMLNESVTEQESLKAKVTETETRMTELEEKILTEECKPIIEDIVTLEGVKDEEAKKTRIEELKAFGKPALTSLKNTLTSAVKAAKAAVLVSEQDAGDAPIATGVNISTKDYTAMTPEEFALQMYTPEELGLTEEQAAQIKEGK